MSTINNVYSSIKGRIDAYDIIVIGHLKYNPVFGESADAPPRGDPSTCTSTMVRGLTEQGERYVLLIDPTLRLSAEDYYFDINRRTGLHPEDVTHCYITHHHFDHQVGVNYFPNAVWYAHPDVAKLLRDSTFIDGSRIKEVEGEFLPGISDVALPGHTLSLHGIAFNDGDLRVLVAADSVMTGGHFKSETCMFEEDAQVARETIRDIKQSIDLVVPGHDNVIVNLGWLRR